MFRDAWFKLKNGKRVWTGLKTAFLGTQEGRKQKQEERLREKQAYREAYIKGRMEALRRRGIKEGARSARPFGQKLMEGMAGIQRGMKLLDTDLGMAPKHRGKRRKKKV